MSVRKRRWPDPVTGPNEAWVADYVDGNGRRHRKQFKMKKDALAFEKRAGTEVADGVHIADTDSQTIAAAGELWIATKAKAGREQATVAQYRQHLDLHIKPYIGGTKLNAFNAPALAAWERRLADDGRSLAMIRKVRVSLGSILARAQREGWTARNIVRDMRGVGQDSDAKAEKRAKGRLRVGVDIPSPVEIKAIVGVLSGRWRPLLLTAIFCGLRASELRGLTWPAVDFDKKLLHVRQRADRFNAIGRPKSDAGDRDVPMPDLVANTLREWKLQCPRRDTGKKDADGNPVKVLELVFPNGQGKVESLANIINRGLCPAMVKAGVTVDSGKLDPDGNAILVAKYTGMHALRHFNASWMINRPEEGGLGLTPKQVQTRLGHSSITLTMDVYSHLFPSQDDGGQMSSAAAAFLA
ncbi:tyrosine-type recombinase/integrase [Devosia alba]|uniref:tyrosine-type recombinase/integrase n=1 Tax=Devosia alba TaxID=3152360 RepID=UPI0032677299